MAKHLKHWFKLQNSSITLLTWNRNQDISKLQSFLQTKPLVWLAISDSSLVEFYESNLAKCGLATVHFSGALHDTRMMSAHPLMSFPDKLFEDSFYQEIHFVISNCESLQQALPGFENNFSSVSIEHKALYHALCVIAGNFPQLLWNEVFKEAHKLKIPEHAFEIYIKKITENFIDLKSGALTGPLVRKDKVTIQKNIQSLAESLKLQNIYRTFAKEFES
jgi:hypothetical protein